MCLRYFNDIRKLEILFTCVILKNRSKPGILEDFLKEKLPT